MTPNEETYDLKRQILWDVAFANLLLFPVKTIFSLKR